MGDPSDIATKKARILDEKRNVTGRISETCRYVGFGLLVVYYAIQSGDSAFEERLRLDHSPLIYLVGACGVFSIAFDYLQYFFAARSVDEAYRRPTADFDPHSVAYKARQVFFYLKQIVAVLGASLLVFMAAY